MLCQTDIHHMPANRAAHDAKAGRTAVRARPVFPALLALLLATTAAHAATLEQVHNIDQSGVEFEEVVTFDLFNEPGTLTGVVLTIDVVSEGEVALNLCQALENCDPAQFFLSANAFGGGIGSGDSLDVNYGTNAAQYPTFSAHMMGAIGADPLQFVGDGQTDEVTVSGTYFGSYFFGEGSHTGTLTLTYTYDLPAEVPLPATLPLALGGLVLLRGIARRRKVGQGR